MNNVTLLKLLVPLLQAILVNLPATTPSYVILLINTAMKAIDLFQVSDTNFHPANLHALAPSHGLPHESEWTVEGLEAFAQRKVAESYA